MCCQERISGHFADDIGVGKPDPFPYAATLDALDTIGEALAFEDSPSGTASSTSAGVPNVGVAAI